MDTSTNSQLASLRQSLESRLSALQAELLAAQRARGAAQDEPEAGDTKDLADRLQHDELDEAQVHRELGAMAAIEAALRRVDDGSYGDCIDCGEPVGLARLQLLPAASRCAACQGLHESRWSRRSE
ncbi:TraR/DksA family transcriptional regulator [Paucibacter sp. JuS9]|uniref:TraR/DksA family transcriptional regulator n=1 Tax=Roseateles TaxID=93681 RepID=UPI002FE62AC6